MKIQLQESKICGTSPLISYKPESTVNMITEYKSNSFKGDIKNHPGETGSKTISLYVRVFKEG